MDFVLSTNICKKIRENIKLTLIGIQWHLLPHQLLLEAVEHGKTLSKKNKSQISC
jgi:hypothetical protein